MTQSINDSTRSSQEYNIEQAVRERYAAGAQQAGLLLKRHLGMPVSMIHGECGAISGIAPVQSSASWKNL